MSDEPRTAFDSVRRELSRWNWIRGFLGTATLLLLVFTLAAGYAQFRDGPFTSSNDMWLFIKRGLPVCSPVALFWFWFFARYRRPEPPPPDDGNSRQNDRMSGAAPLQASQAT
jgi:hypothetical protein